MQTLRMWFTTDNKTRFSIVVQTDEADSKLCYVLGETMAAGLGVEFDYYTEE